jgi:type IV pilus assembly protein PilX
MKACFVSRGQRGASLIVSLIFLVVMAMLGVTLANVTNLEERMAGHTRDRDLALQAAEAALRDAEVRLSNTAFRTTTAFPAYLATRANDAVYWESCFKDKSTACGTQYEPTSALPASGNPGAVAASPKFVIESKPKVGTTDVFRVTARAVGGSADTIVVLQAEFGYTPP